MVLERLLMLAHSGADSIEGSMLGAPAIRFFAAAIESVSPSRALPRLLWHLSRMGGSWAGVWAAGNTRYHPRTTWLARHPFAVARTRAPCTLCLGAVSLLHALDQT